MGLLAMMEKVCYLSEHLLLVELSLCRKCHGIYHSQEQTGSREACQPSFLSSVIWVKNLLKKGIKQSEMQSE